jgi:hypothetical protein
MPPILMIAINTPRSPGPAQGSAQSTQVFRLNLLCYGNFSPFFFLLLFLLSQEEKEGGAAARIGIKPCLAAGPRADFSGIFPLRML